MNREAGATPSVTPAAPATQAEAVRAVGYEHDDGTLYGYANHLNYAGNPGGIPVRIIREADYVALTAAQQRIRDLEHQLRSVS